MATKRLEVQITGNARGAQQAFADVERSAGGMQSKLAGIARGVGVAVAAGTAALAGGAALMLKGAYDAALESQKIARETERVIQTTGGAANVTAKQVGDLATEVSNLTGVDDELIQQGANLLLTFTNVRNEVGKGNDVFDQATSLALDMSKVLGTDMTSASMQVGKALNDPIKGITALTRAGVSFTAEQKEQIKALVANGDTLGAQKIILGELAREFGGGAAAAAGPMDRLKVQLGNIQEEIGARLIPVMAAAAEWISGTMVPAVQDAVGQLAAGFNGDSDGGFFGRLGEQARSAWTFITQTVVPTLTDAFETVQGAVSDLNLSEMGETLRGAVEPVIDAVSRFDLGEYFSALGDAFQGVMDVGRELYEIFNDMAPVLKVIGVAVGAVAYVMHKVFIKQLEALGWILSNVVSPILRAVGWYVENVMIPGWSKVGEVVGAVFGWIADRARDWWAVVGPLLRAAWAWIEENILPAFRRFASTAAAVFEQVRATIKSKVDAVAGFITGLPGRFASIRDRLYQVIVEPFKSAFNAVAGFWNNTVGKLSFKTPTWVPPPFGGKEWNVPDIPVLHDGGEFRAPRGRSEGLALLRDREVVLTPGQARNRGGTVIHANFHGVSVKAAMAELAFQERRAW